VKGIANSIKRKAMNSSSQSTQHQVSSKPSTASDFVRSSTAEGNVVFKRSRASIPVIQKSLAVVLASLQGVQVVIELKNDDEVTGTVDETDSNMNVTLHNVRQVNAFRFCLR
jgi:LSM domain